MKQGGLACVQYRYIGCSTLLLIIFLQQNWPQTGEQKIRDTMEWLKTVICAGAQFYSEGIAHQYFVGD